MSHQPSCADHENVQTQRRTPHYGFPAMQDGAPLIGMPRVHISEVVHSLSDQGMQEMPLHSDAVQHFAAGQLGPQDQ